MLEIVAYRLTGIGDPSGWTAIQDSIVWDLRLPRVLLAATAGAGLTIVGMSAQVMVNNPLADPFLLGISSGAALGTVAALTSGLTLWGLSSYTAGVLGAAVAFAAVWLLARSASMNPKDLLMVGVLVSSILLGLTNWLIVQATDPAARGALHWIFGDLSASARWPELAVPATAVAAVGLWIGAHGRTLNCLATGAETAASLGISPSRARAQLFVASSILTGIIVAACGAIHFVGLVVPHIARRFAGTDHRRLTPIAALTGAVFLVLADLLARTVSAPAEVPVGIITTVVGSIVALFIFRRHRRGGFGS
ncbi:iron ABC transporter permease [Saccharothrix sp. AJ9571]|nr:iron ABC transporter permease [Saccharothrix sp. AJ9571]